MAQGSAVRSTVLVVTWQGHEHIAECLAALAAQDRPHRTIVVDNASDDGTADVLATHTDRVEVLRLPANRGYAGGLAAALPLVDTEYVAWLNDDAMPEPGWLAALESALDADPGTAAVSSRLVRPDGAVQSLGVRITTDGHGADQTSPVASDPTGGDAESEGPEATEALRAASAATLAAPATPVLFGFCGGAALLRASALRAVGGVPAAFFCYYEDTDTSWRLRLHGWSIRSVPTATVLHLHGASTRPGSAEFHRWNERNRLLTLLRCAPREVALRELARFAAITVTVRVRQALGHDVPAALNLRPPLRLRVLADIARRAAVTLVERRVIGHTIRVRRITVWRQWAGR